MPKVSVIVPVYNVEKYIGRCIESVLNQTLHDLELILVDDHGVDDSMSVVKRYAEQDSRIRYIESDENVGPMMAREKGYLSAVGDYLTFVDGDDTLPVDAIKILYERAISCNADIVVGDMEYHSLNGTRTQIHNYLNYGDSSEAIYRSLLLGELTQNLCSKLFKKKLFEGYKYDTYKHFTNAEDGYLFYEIILNAKSIVQEKVIVYNYLQNTGSSTNTRLSSNAINNICKMNQLRHELTSKYANLDRLRNRFITNVLYNLLSDGYIFDTSLKECIKNYNLQDYLFLKRDYFSHLEIFKYLLKRYLMGPLMFLKSKI